MNNIRIEVLFLLVEESFTEVPEFVRIGLQDCDSCTQKALRSATSQKAMAVSRPRLVTNQGMFGRMSQAFTHFQTYQLRV
jgi:hypothetical protein